MLNLRYRISVSYHVTPAQTVCLFVDNIIPFQAVIIDPYLLFIKVLKRSYLFSWLVKISANGLSVRLLNNSWCINQIMASGNKTPYADLHKNINAKGKHLTFGPRSTTIG